MTITLKLPSREVRSEIICERGIFARKMPELLKKYSQSLIFTDENVLRLYGDLFQKVAPDVPMYAMKAGEEHKQPQTLVDLLAEMSARGLHRGACLFAVGGGVVGDVGGLASALYMRGIDCVQVPTTLLSQVDSSVGGKTAVDLGNIKNIIGAFKQPKTVLVDGEFLKTLPEREIACGLGEIVKHGALNGGIFDKLEEQSDLFDLSFLERIVPDNIAHKAAVVEEDELETGLRKSLNLGHTTGHALELYEKTRSHGEYVLIGTYYEAEIARRVAHADGAYLDRLEKLVFSAMRQGKIPSAAEAAEYARLDKKNSSNDKITIAAPVAKGKYELIELPSEEYVRLLKEIYQEKLC